MGDQRTPFDAQSMAFTDETGLTTLQPGQQSQDGVLYSVEHLINGLSQAAFLEDAKARAKALVDIFKILTVQPGLQRRSPGSTEYDSMDNTTARLAFEMIIKDLNLGVEDLFAEGMNSFNSKSNLTEADTSYPDAGQVTESQQTLLLARIIGLGKARFCFNVSDPTKFCFYSWFGRSPGLLALKDFAAGGLTTPLRWVGLLVGQMIGMFADPSNTDARTLAYVIWFPLKKRNWFWALMYKIWVWRLMKTYPNGMIDVYKLYYLNPEQPTRLFAIAHH
jgi:hypothetical protein